MLTGSYAQLPEASGRVFEIVAEKKIPVRDDYNIENYLNDPRTTPEDQLITEILMRPLSEQADLRSSLDSLRVQVSIVAIPFALQ